MKKQLIDQIDERIEEIHQLMAKPGSKLLTSMQMETRAYSMRSMRTGIKLHGGKVNKEFE